jgi:hypothetical protein
MDNRAYPPKRGGRGKPRGGYAGPPGYGRGGQPQQQYVPQNQPQHIPPQSNAPPSQEQPHSGIAHPYQSFQQHHVHPTQPQMPMSTAPQQPYAQQQAYGMPSYYQPFGMTYQDSSSSFFSQQPFTTSSEPLSTVAQQLQNLSFSSQPLGKLLYYIGGIVL